jgi:hypothetical protein
VTHQSSAPKENPEEAGNSQSPKFVTKSNSEENYMIRNALVVVAALIAVSCGGPNSPSEFNIAGSWAGFSANRGVNYTLTVAQNGSSLTGTWASIVL